MSRRAYISVFGDGLGHVSRMLALAERLSEIGVETIFSSWGEARSLVLRTGRECLDSPPIHLGWDKMGGFSLSRSARRMPLNGHRFVQHLSVEGRRMELLKPDLVISDSRLSSILAAHSRGIPSMAVINQLRILSSRSLTPLAHGIQEVVAHFLARLWSRADEIVVPDLPPPYTISESHFAGLEGVGRSPVFVGFWNHGEERNGSLPGGLAEELSGSQIRVAYAQISGPAATRYAFSRLVLEAGELLDSGTRLVVSMGDPLGRDEPIRAGRSILFEWCPFRDEMMNRCDLLVCRSGHSTLAQAVHLGKPTITVPIPGHGEQEANARKISRMGVGLALDQTDLTPSRLADAISNAVRDPSLKARSQSLREVAREYSGLDRTVEMASRLMEGRVGA